MNSLTNEGTVIFQKQKHKKTNKKIKKIMTIFICSFLVLLKIYICPAYLLLQIVPQMSDVAPEPLVTLSANQTITSQIH